MLVFSRKKEETIVLDGGRIIVKVCEIKSGRVRLGVICDKTTEVNRGEIQEKVDAARAAETAVNFPERTPEPESEEQ